MKKKSTTLNVEFANRPPTIDDVSKVALRLFARSLVEAYKRYQKKQEEERKQHESETTAN